MAFNKCPWLAQKVFTYYKIDKTNRKGDAPFTPEWLRYAHNTPNAGGEQKFHHHIGASVILTTLTLYTLTRIDCRDSVSMLSTFSVKWALDLSSGRRLSEREAFKYHNVYLAYTFLSNYSSRHFSSDIFSPLSFIS